MQFRPWRTRRAKSGRGFSHSNGRQRPFQRLLTVESLEARRMLDAGIGILLLDHSSLGALYSSGSGGVHVLGGGSLVIDSKNHKAGIDVGAGNVSAGAIEVTGGLDDGGPGDFLGTVSHPAATTDPFSGLAAPPNTTPVHSAVNVSGSTSLTLSPGTYRGGIHISGNATVTLMPGIYNLQGGGLSIVENGTLTGTGVTIYNGAKKPSDSVFIGGNATVSLTAPNSGTYQDIVVFQNRNSAAPIIVNGGNIHLNGMVYAPKATLYFDSNTSLNVGGSSELGITGELICKDLVRMGAGNINVDATNNNIADLAITITDDSGGSDDTGDDGGDQEDDVSNEITPDQAEAGEAVPGESVTYTITVTNNGPLAVTGATVQDAFPSAIGSDSYTAVGSSGTSSGFTPSGSGNINDTVNLASGATIVYTVIAQIASSATGSLVDTATVTAPASPSDPITTNNSATDTLTLTPQADLAITKTDNTDSAIPGNPVTYIIVVSNNGPSDVTGATVNDMFPSAVSSDTYTAGVTTGTASGFTTSGTGNIDDTVNLAAGASITYTVTANISSAATGSLTNTATVSVPSGTADTDMSNNSATDTDSLTPQVDLAITKVDDQGGSSTTASLGTAVPGQSITYTIVVTNNGPSDVMGATVGDTFPAGISSDTYTAGIITGTASGFTTSGSGNISDTVNLAAGASITYTVTANIDPAATGNLSNTATVSVPSGTTETNASNNSATDTDTLTPQADLSITKDDGMTEAVPGNNVTYTIVVTNNGPSTATNVEITDVLPNDINFVSASQGTYDSGTGIDSIGSIDPGNSVTLTLTGTVNGAATGSISNTATVSSSTTDTNLGNNSANDTDTLTPQADLSVTKTDGQTSAVPGDQDTYTITVTNNGPSTVTSLTLTDTVPAALTNASFMASTGSYDSSTGIWSGLNLASGQSVTLHLSGTIDPTATGNLVNSVTVSAPAGVTDTNSSNNTDTDTDTLTPQADLSVTKTDGTEFVFQGGNVSYTITVTNNGPSTVTAVNLNDTVPAVLTNASFTPATGNYDSSSGDWMGLNLATGQTATMQLTGTVSPQATGNLINSVTVLPPAGTTDPDMSNNTAVDTDEIDEPIG
jgi:uncharacterized repeat protein (TIGR01451 family)